MLVVRRELVRNRVPTAPGGGTVAFVDPLGHRYLDDPVAREEGGTPAIVESIRAGLVVGLKQAVGTELIQAREQRLWHRALERWQANPNIELLGNPHARRLSIVSFRLRVGDRYLHHNFVVALLNDQVSPASVTAALRRPDGQSDVPPQPDIGTVRIAAAHLRNVALMPRSSNFVTRRFGACDAVGAGAPPSQQQFLVTEELLER